jgi:ribosomal protein S12 methylthiotransferase
MEDQIHHMTRKARWNEAMRAIQRGVEHFNTTQVGKTMRVLVEEPGVARSEMDAPDIDTTVFVNKKLPVGSFADMTVKDQSRRGVRQRLARGT